MDTMELVRTLPKNAYSLFMLKQRGGMTVSEICKASQIADLANDATIDSVELLAHVNTERACQIYCHSENIPYLYDVTSVKVHSTVSESSNIKKWCEKNQLIVAEHSGCLLMLCSDRECIQNRESIINEFFAKTNLFGEMVVMGCSAKQVNDMLNSITPNDEYIPEILSDSPLGELINKVVKQDVRQVWISKSNGSIAFFQHEKSFLQMKALGNPIPQLSDFLTEKCSNNRYKVDVERRIYQLEVHDFTETIMMTVHCQLNDSDTSSSDLPYPLSKPFKQYREAVTNALQQESPLILCLNKNACTHLIASEVAKTAIDFLKNNSANILINTNYYYYEGESLVPISDTLVESENVSHLNALAYLIGVTQTKDDFTAIQHHIENLTPIFAVTNCKESMLPTQLRTFAVSI